jgi:hypothetical protein
MYMAIHGVRSFAAAIRIGLIGTMIFSLPLWIDHFVTPIGDYDVEDSPYSLMRASGCWKIGDVISRLNLTPYFRS